MGYELNKLMRQFGVSSPTLGYTGTSSPVSPAALASDATDEQKAAFDTAQQQYATQKTAYDADLAKYNAYKQDYLARTQNTPQYMDAQYQTAPSAAMSRATGLGGAGADALKQDIRDWFTQNPSATPTDVRAAMDKYGVSGYDVAQARGGSMWGTPLAMPTYKNYGSTTAGAQTATPTTSTVKQPVVQQPTYAGLTAQSSPADIAAAYGQFIGGANADTAANRSTAIDYLTGLGVPQDTIGQAYNTYLTSQPTQLYSDLSAQSSPADIARAYNQYVAGAGGNTAANQQTAIDYLRGLGVNDAAIGQAYNQYTAGTFAKGGSVHALAKKYADGGAVDATDTQDQLPMPAVMAQPAPQMAAPNVPQAVGAMQPGGNQQLLSLLGRYFPQGDEYGADLKAARETVSKESQAFQDLLKKAMESKGESGPSKSEMYFRLAAAFGAPTRTGAFVESLGKAGEATSEMLKERRAAELASRTQNLQLGLEAQKMRMTGAKEDLVTLRQLAAEGMKDKRTIATELIKDYVKSGQPQSTAGKQAQDEGLTPNTPEFQKRVAQIADMNVEKQMAQVNATLANMSVAQANLALNQQKFQNVQAQQSKLSPQEMKLKTETEDTIAQTQQGYENLKKALALNPNTFDTSLPDTAQRKLLEAAGSKDKKLQDTREMENLLEKAALSQLKSTFPGQISNEERKALMATQGLGAKSIEERGKIMENAASAMRSIYQRSKKRLNEINQGLYRETNIPTSGGEE